jgi:peptidoglycan/LPS O-acetylase OafA/YrhL
VKRFLALDALRAILALCVALGHMGPFPLFGPVGQADPTLDLLARGWRTVVFGPPAVIAFFLISGFCIHYPFAQRKEACPLGRFYARRYIRILVPVVCTVALFKLLFPQTVLIGANSILFHSTLWSIVCEEIYYAVYPLLNRVGARFGWGAILAASAIPSLAVGWYYFPAIDWSAIGVFPTALTLFPVWLAGCYMAEHVSSLKQAYSPLHIWMWRLGAWAVMWAALYLQFHSSLHQTVTGPVVGAIYYFWIRAELCYYREREPWPILVWAGKWSYSLYLVHPIIIGVATGYLALSLGSRPQWLLVFGATLLGAYLFYLAVERPSHNLARRIPLFARPAAPPDLARASNA